MQVEEYIKVFISSPAWIVAAIIFILMIIWALLANLQGKKKDLVDSGDLKSYMGCYFLAKYVQ